MPQVNETKLPGVGVRHEFTCDDGDRIGLITHHSGRRQLLVFAPDDPDYVTQSVSMTSDEANALAELLGGATLVERFDDLRQHIAELSLDWLPVPEHSRYAGAELGATEMRTRTGVSVIAVIRGRTTIPSPGPETILLAGDIVVVVGVAGGIDAAASLLKEP